MGSDRIRRTRIAGTAVLLLGLAAVVVVLFVPLSSNGGGQCDGDRGGASGCQIWQWLSRIPLDARTITFLVVMGVLAASIGIVALSRAHGSATVAGVSIATALWWAGIVLSLASIGMFFVPAGIAAIVVTLMMRGRAT
ncbi:MAG: hypothetical protein J2O49_00535 [Sciscionella sp.]|nr:hypothetical protein [Sciscionella sp.]